MKKLCVILLAFALVFMLCACKTLPWSEPSEIQTQTQSQSESESQSLLQTHNSAVSLKEGVLDINDPYYADGLNDYGLPDLSRFSADQIWDMYVHPENWSPDVLSMADSTFDFDESGVYSDTEVDPQYTFDLGEWHDYNPGNWTPGPEEITEFDIDDSEFDDNGGYDPSILILPEEYAFLVPGGLRPEDIVVNDKDGLNIALKNRTSEEYAAIVQAARDHGYTRNAESNSYFMPYYTAGNGKEVIAIAYYQKSVMISFD